MLMISWKMRLSELTEPSEPTTERSWASPPRRREARPEAGGWGLFGHRGSSAESMAKSQSAGSGGRKAGIRICVGGAVILGWGWGRGGKNVVFVDENAIFDAMVEDRSLNHGCQT